LDATPGKLEPGPERAQVARLLAEAKFTKAAGKLGHAL
jgi:hypothetical protein